MRGFRICPFTDYYQMDLSQSFQPTQKTWKPLLLIRYSSVQAEARYFSVHLMGSKSSNKILYLHSQPIHILSGRAKVMELSNR